ncbi:hypothetical protein BGZ94_010357 [Podila epigama]|nr:hypothetical protein BGZ94_010357 [Podila epigama]
MSSPSSPPSSSSSSSDHEPQTAHTWTEGQELAAKLVFGGLGCMIAVVFTNPVDVIKVRLQLQGEEAAPSPRTSPSTSPHTLSGGTSLSASSPHPSSSIPKALHVSGPTLLSATGPHLSSMSTTAVSSSVSHRDAALMAHNAFKPAAVTLTATTAATINTSARPGPPKTLRLIPLLREIIRNEGPGVFLSGLAPAVLREGVYSTIRFGSYDFFKGIYSGVGSAGLRRGEETSTLEKLMSGLTSGMLGSTIANPTDLIKGREEGIPGLYRGVVPTAARAMVVTASQLASYDTTKHWLLGLKNSDGQRQFQEGYLVHFVASTVAGLVCSISTSPIDTIKVRYMNQEFNAQGQGALYRSAMDCAVKTVSREGPLALYKGFLMCWLRLGPHTMLSLMIFEKLRSFVGINPV